MATTASTTKKPTTRRRTTTRRKPQTQTPATPQSRGDTVRDHVAGAVKSVVNVPVGAALTAYDQVNDAVQRLSERETTEKEIKRVRTDLRRELKRFERRGTVATNRARRELTKSRNRVQRTIRKRRNSVQKQVNQNRSRVRSQLRRSQKHADTLQSSVHDFVSSRSGVAQKVVGQVGQQVNGVVEQVQSLR